MKKTALVTGFISALPAMSMAQAWGYGPCDWGMHRYFGFGGGIAMWVLTIAVLGVLVFFGARMVKDRTGGSSGTEDPLKILQARYAKGEITREQFESMKKDLQ